MNWNKQLKYWAWALAMPLALAACDDNNGNPGGGDGDGEFRAERGIYVFNTGNEGNSIDGSLSFIDLASPRGYKNNVFFTVNGRSLGSTVQDGVVLGDELYIAVSGSNTIEVVDKHTAESVAQIAPTASQGSQPRDIVTDGRYVYVSMFDGFVSRIDPSTHAIDRTVAVGPNPEEMAVLDGCLYVANSDGLNYGNGYVNGKSVSQINLSDFTEETRIPVGVNPTKVVAHEASGKLFVICMGDYAANPNSLWTIDTTRGNETTDLHVAASLMCLSGNTLYTVYNQYGSPEANRYVSYNAADNTVLDEDFIPAETSDGGLEYNLADNPAGIVADPESGHLFVSSYVNDPVNAYSLPGYVLEYDAQGQLLARYDLGVGAVNMMLLE